MTAYSPGPWRVAAGFVVDADDGLVADICAVDALGLADAALIASAPDMLAMLKSLAPLSASGSALEKLIERAEGRTS